MQLHDKYKNIMNQLSPKRDGSLRQEQSGDMTNSSASSKVLIVDKSLKLPNINLALQKLPEIQIIQENISTPAKINGSNVSQGLEAWKQQEEERLMTSEHGNLNSASKTMKLYDGENSSEDENNSPSQFERTFN